MRKSSSYRPIFSMPHMVEQERRRLVARCVSRVTTVTGAAEAVAPLPQLLEKRGQLSLLSAAQPREAGSKGFRQERKALNHDFAARGRQVQAMPAQIARVDFPAHQACRDQPLEIN